MAEINPYLIITAGNTGSGKTSLITETLRYLGIDDQPYVKILIDDLVEMDCKYKVSVIQIINKISELSRNESKTEREYYTDPSDELYEAFTKSYFKVRNEPGCLGTELSCDELNNKNLNEAIRDRKNIIFEFTGQYIPTWLLKLEMLGDIYNVVFSCSVVNLKNLLERNTSRAFTAVNDFKKDYGKPAPRLPNVSRPKLIENVTQFKRILNQIYSNCITSYSAQICGTKRINKLLVFDNNGSRMSLIFDSDISSEVDFEAINSSFGVLEESPIRKRKSPLIKRKSPLIKRKSPLRKRKSPTIRKRKSPLRKRKSPLRKRKSPLRRKVKN